MKNFSLKIHLLLLLFGSGFLLGSAAQGAIPFDAGTAASEQLLYFGKSPQIVATGSKDTLTVSTQLYDGGNPTLTKLIHFKRSGNSFSKVWEKQLPLPRLIGMTSDGANYYIVSAVNEEMGADTNPNVFRPNILIMNKLDAQGKDVWQKDLNTPEYLPDTARAIYTPLGAGSGAVSYGKGKIAVTFASNTAAYDGVRHQQAQYFVVGANGEGYKASGETSFRHSFDQRLVFDGQDFVLTDLGDAGWYMPGGGLAVRKIRPNANGAEFINEGEAKQGTYIYMRQAETENGQNFTFTALGDLAVGAQGYLALFTSETSNPSAIRNGFFTPVAEPRNLGFVHVRKNFETVREGSWDGMVMPGNTKIVHNLPVSVDISSNVVDSPGASQKFSRPQKTSLTFNQIGIVWLTDLQAGVSAERAKIVDVGNGRFVAVWEEWTYSGTTMKFQATKAIIINETGQKLAGPVAISARLNPSGADRPFAVDGRAHWITADAQSGKYELHMVDGNLVHSLATIDPNAAAAPNIYIEALKSGDILRPGERVRSKNGQYDLIYQSDGDLAIYDINAKRIWSSKTAGKPAGYAAMQSDGNFAIYGPDGSFQWNTGTQTPGSQLFLQGDGNLIIKAPDGKMMWQSMSSVIPHTLWPSERLRVDRYLLSANKEFYMKYQSDGNLGIYRKSNNQYIWDAKVTSSNAGYAIMQANGNFSLHQADGTMYWSTGTNVPGSAARLQDNAKLEILSPSGQVLWPLR